MEPEKKLKSRFSLSWRSKNVNKLINAKKIFENEKIWNFLFEWIEGFWMGVQRRKGRMA